MTFSKFIDIVNINRIYHKPQCAVEIINASIEGGGELDTGWDSTKVNNWLKSDFKGNLYNLIFREDEGHRQFDGDRFLMFIKTRLGDRDELKKVFAKTWPVVSDYSDEDFCQFIMFQFVKIVGIPPVPSSFEEFRGSVQDGAYQRILDGQNEIIGNIQDSKDAILHANSELAAETRGIMGLINARNAAIDTQTKILEELRDSGDKQSTTQTAGEYPLYVAVPCLFSPITISAKRHVLYQCGYDDRSAVVIKGSYGLGQFAVISNDYVLRMEPLNKISDIPQSLKDAVVKIITGLGSGFSNKRIGFTYGHKETTRVETLNADLKGMLLAQDLRIEKCSHEMFFTCDVLIVSSPLEPLTEDEQAALLGYITNGGSVLFCGIGYYWVAFNDENGVKRKIEDFPINKLGKFLGFQIEPSYIGKSIHYEKETNKIPLYFTPLQLSSENPIVSADEKIMAIIKGALTNDPAEQGKLGLLFEVGRGLPKNSDYALYWYKMASFRNTGAAQYMLAALYEKTNDFLFITWLILSAGNGYYIALGRLGFAYYDGTHGLQKNEKMGIDGIKQAAEKGWGNAIYRLGVIALDKGMYKEAGVWFTKICYGKNIGERFITEAHYQLGILLRDGKGFDKDLYKARAHFAKAAKGGHNGAKTAGSLLDNELKGVFINELLFDEKDEPVFTMKILEGTPYENLDNAEKEKIIAYLEDEYNLWVGEKIAGYLTAEQLAIFDKICADDVETIKTECERLGIPGSVLYQELKALHPDGDDFAIQSQALDQMWLPLYAPAIFGAKYGEIVRIKQRLVSGELDIKKAMR